MKIYKSKLDNKLYTIQLVSPPKYTGSWYDAVPYQHLGKIQQKINLKDYVQVSQR